MFGRILISTLAAAAIILLLWSLRGFMLMPLKLGKRTSLTVTLRITGPEPRLEETLDGIIWLRQNGTLPAEIILEDAGMDEETRETAELAAKSFGGISFCLGRQG